MSIRFDTSWILQYQIPTPHLLRIVRKLYFLIFRVWIFTPWASLLTNSLEEINLKVNLGNLLKNSAFQVNKEMITIFFILLILNSWKKSYEFEITDDQTDEYWIKQLKTYTDIIQWLKFLIIYISLIFLQIFHVFVDRQNSWRMKYLQYL